MDANINHQLVHAYRPDDGESLPGDDGKRPPRQESEKTVRVADGKSRNLRTAGREEPPPVADTFPLFDPLHEGDPRLKREHRL